MQQLSHPRFMQVRQRTSVFRYLPVNTGLKSWETFNEDISFVEEDSTISATGLLEQLNVTRDATDYLWYTTG